MSDKEVPSVQDWELLLSLAGTGAGEHLWAWETGTSWPGDWSRGDYEDLIRRCADQLLREGKLS